MGSLVEATGAHYDSFYVQHVGDEAVSYLLVLSAVQSIFFERKMETQLRLGLGQREPRLPPPSPCDCWAQRLLRKATWVGDAQGCPGRSGMRPGRRLAFVQLLGFPEWPGWEGNHGSAAGRTFGSQTTGLSCWGASVTLYLGNFRPMGPASLAPEAARCVPSSKG